MIIGEKKKHINRTLCAHCGKEMAREENKVYLEVRPSLKKSIIFLEMHL
jgi:phage FluMu protein Com